MKYFIMWLLYHLSFKKYYFNDFLIPKCQVLELAKTDGIPGLHSLVNIA